MLRNILRRATCCALVQWIPITLVCAAMLTHNIVCRPCLPRKLPIQSNFAPETVVPICCFQFNCSSPISSTSARLTFMTVSAECSRKYFVFAWVDDTSEHFEISFTWHFFRVSCRDYRSHTLRFDTLCNFQIMYYRSNAELSMRWEPVQKRSPFNEWRMNVYGITERSQTVPFKYK